jgi:acyl carrier protein
MNQLSPKKLDLTYDSFEELIRRVVGEQLGHQTSEVKPHSDFYEDLGADSLDIIELVMALEEELEIELSDDEAERAGHTVESVCKFLPKNCPSSTPISI